MFRAYLLDAKGRIAWGDWFEAADEQDALNKAKDLCREGTPTVEVWKGPKKVGSSECAPEPPRAAARPA